jgi:pyruvate/2-oxoglutarate dehydrogenase complex dihydrolipoamide acyltransferase (E2) component
MSKAVPVRMPKMTLAAVEGTFLEWLVEDGQRVVEDEPLYTVETEKVEAEVPSPATGVLRYGAAERDVVYEVGTQLAVIEVSDDG